MKCFIFACRTVLSAVRWSVVAVALFIAAFASGAIHRVDPMAPGNGPGFQANWSDAYDSLAALLDLGVVQSGDKVLVAGGQYKPTDQFSSFNLITGATIQGGFAGYNGLPTPDTRNEISILDGDIDDNDPATCLPGETSCPGGESAFDDNARIVVQVYEVQAPGAPLNESSDFADRANLDGFEITGGYNQSLFGDRSGGISVISDEFSQTSNAIIRNCNIYRNYTIGLSGGGGVHVQAGNALVLRKCNIHHNHAPVEGGGLSVSGSVTLLNCEVHHNITSTDFGDGAGLSARPDRLPP